MIVLQSSTYKGGLGTLDDPECNLGDQIYYYFVPDWLGMDVTRSASECLEPNFRSVGDHIYYYFVPDWPGMDVTRSVSEGLEPNFRSVLLEKLAIGGGGGNTIRDLLDVCVCNPM